MQQIVNGYLADSDGSDDEVVIYCAGGTGDQTTAAETGMSESRPGILSRLTNHLLGEKPCKSGGKSQLKTSDK